MAHINFLGGLKRELHHVKKIDGNGHEEYEPAMFLFRDELKGRSFCVPLSCLWKYLDPKDNKDMRTMDSMEFDKLAGKIYNQRQFMRGVRSATALQLADDAAAVILAEQMNENSGVMLCTAYSLVKCCQILDMTVGAQALAQLLMFIQDGLEDLKNMPEHERENSVEHGEATISVNGQKFHKAITMSESDLVVD